jgi:hypothetical protein
VTEAHQGASRRAARPWSLGIVLGLCLVAVVGLTPVIAATGAHGRGGHAGHGERARATSQAMLGPARVILGLGALFSTQFDGSAYANGNCNMAAGAMLFEVQTGRAATGALLRRWSGAHTRGTSLLDLRRAFRRQGQAVVTREDFPWRSFVREVRRGRSAVVQGWYGNLPARQDLQPGYTGAHSVFVLGFSRHAMHGHGGFYVMDPLGHNGYDGAWWSPRTLRHFGWGGSPHVIGTGRSAWFGNVALQAQPSRKRLSARAYRPAFQSYWDTSKELMQRARTVRVAPVRPGRPALVLRIHDPRLTLSASRARQRGMAWPLASWSRLSRGYRAQDRVAVMRALPHAQVTAAATGRVVYRGWSLHGGQTLWVQHGPHLYTVYKGLAKVRVEPGQWVRTGKVLGKLSPKAGTKQSELRFSVAVGSGPPSASALKDPVRFLKSGHRGID